MQSLESGLELSVSRISSYYLQWWLCYSSSKIGIFQFFGGVKCASSDSVHHVINYVRRYVTTRQKIRKLPRVGIILQSSDRNNMLKLIKNITKIFTSQFRSNSNYFDCVVQLQANSKIGRCAARIRYSLYQLVWTH